jgi:septal ring-binding cell division protein DamX
LVVAFIDITLTSGDIKAAVSAPVAVSPSPGYSAAQAAAIRAANDAAAKAETEKLAAAKAEADAKAAAEAAAKAAADKAALEKAAAERAAADKIAAEERAAAEAIVKAEEARVAAAEAKAAASNVKVTSSKTGTKLTLDLADKYFGKIVTVFVGTKKNGKVTYRVLDYFAVDKEDGTASISTKVKLTKGQIIRVNVGKTVVKSLTLK